MYIFINTCYCVCLFVCLCVMILQSHLLVVIGALALFARNERQAGLEDELGNM